MLSVEDLYGDPDFIRNLKRKKQDVVICIYNPDEESSAEKYDADCVLPHNVKTGDALAAFIRSRIGE